MPPEASKARYFASPAELRAWLRKHHAAAAELLVGFHKRGSGAPSITWPEAVDEALCVGWIDGVRRRVDEHRYVIRFTPRRPRSIWSAVNVRRAGELVKEKRMRPAGLAAFAARTEQRSVIYSYEQAPAKLDASHARRFRQNPPAWVFFSAQPPSYRQKCLWWVASAKQEVTRLKRLQRLIAASARQRRL